MLYEKTFEYFEHFLKKILKGLREMFSEDVVLRDWDIFSNGIDEVVP